MKVGRKNKIRRDTKAGAMQGKILKTKKGKVGCENLNMKYEKKKKLIFAGTMRLLELTKERIRFGQTA